MNIALLDDSSAHNAQMREAILRICREEQLPVEIRLEATTFEEIQAYAASDPPQTVYFMDIRLEAPQTGIDICRHITRENVRDRYIFVSAYPHYALDCLNVHAYDLLLKPVDMDALRNCLRSVYRDIQADGSDMLDICIGSRLIRMPVNNIYYIEAQGRNVVAHTSRGNYTWAATLSSMKALLEPYNFIQIHRRYLANRAHILEWDTTADTVTVHGEALPFSRRVRRELAKIGGGVRHVFDATDMEHPA